MALSRADVALINTPTAGPAVSHPRSHHSIISASFRRPPPFRVPLPELRPFYLVLFSFFSLVPPGDRKNHSNSNASDEAP